IAVLVILGRDGTRSIAVTGSLIVLARVALLAVRIDDDAWHIFTFDVYASRILGPFSRSPFDLLMTAAALLAIAVAATRRRSPSAISVVVRGLVAIVAGFGFVILIGNLVDNSRLSAVPDHIVPPSIVQGVLLTALMLFAFTLLQITRHESTPVRALLA